MNYEKIAPGLLLTLQDYRKQGSEGLRRWQSVMDVPAKATSAVGAWPPADRPAEVMTFIRSDKHADLRDLAGNGIRIKQPGANQPGAPPPVADVRSEVDEQVVTAFVPLNALGELADYPEVRRIVPSRRLRPLMDVAPAAVGLPEFRSHNGATGRNVIIGVVDTGIDARHPAFAGPAGQRIISIWDQTMNGSGVPGAAYGHECTGDELVLSVDTEGHGTHVAGIAGAADPTFGGVAPEAKFVIVKTDLEEAKIADGIRYIFDKAALEEQPAVVNLSMGGHFDAHDGSDPLSAVINSESGSGRIVCCAAGNEGNDNIHGRVVVQPSEERSMGFLVPPAAQVPWLNARLNGWYGGAAELEVAVQTPGGFITSYQPIHATGDPVDTHELPDATVEIATPGPNPENGDHQFLVQLRPAAHTTVFSGSVWRLWLRHARGRESVVVDVWTVDDQPSPQVVFSDTSVVSNAMKIGSPGCAEAAVTVASYTTKVEWKDSRDQRQAVGLTLDDISDFSSEGPLRDNTPKPDVAAPGAMIAAARSGASTADLSSVVNPQHVIMAGTSMATPFISGVVALLLQHEPNYGPSDVKQFLRDHSMVPNMAAGAEPFDLKWGYGKIDLANATFPARPI